MIEMFSIRTPRLLFLFLVFSSSFCLNSQVQNVLQKSNYVGILPSFLAEPYDTIDALEINVFPLVYERRFKEKWGIQLRPIINYRIYKPHPGISHIGGTLLVNRYVPELIKKDDFWITPNIGAYFSYTYNKIESVNTLILGLEPGVLMRLSERFSLNLALQPGIDYFPDDHSRNFVNSSSGFKAHFGFIFHVGYNF